MSERADSAFRSGRVLPLRPRLPLLGVTLLACALAGLNSFWLWRFRLGYPVNYDEAAYLGMAFYDTLGLRTAGPYGLLRAVLVQGPAAPLLPLLTVPIHLLFGQQVLPAFLVVQGFVVLLVLASYAIGARPADAGLGLVVALVVATAPGVTEYARMYHPAVPSAALFTAAIYALLQSDRLRRIGWVVGWGVLLGLMVLTRTVMLAIVPGLVLAAVLQLAPGDDRGRRALHLGLGVVVGVLIAAAWYWRNLPRVVQYLLSGGFGETSELDAVSRPLASWEFWAARLSNLVQQGLYVPLGLCLLAVLAAGLACTGARLIRVAEAPDRSVGWQGDAATVAVVLLASYLALSSSNNVGSGFVLILLPATVALAIGSLSCLSPGPWRAALVGALVLVSAGNLVMHTLLPDLSAPRMVRIAELGDHPVTDGRADIQKVLAQAGYDPGPPSRISSLHREWLELDREVAAFLSDFAAAHGHRPVAWFASRDPLFNISSVRMAGLMHLEQDIALDQLSALTAGDRPEGYRATIVNAREPLHFLIAADPGPGEFRPYVTQEYAESAARALGFEIVRTYVLPGGREVRIWWRA